MTLSDNQSQGLNAGFRFQAHMLQYNWIANQLHIDFGEDYDVHINNQHGNSTGLSFHVQLKSSHDVSTRTLASGLITYPFGVKKLVRYERQSTPILLVLWDMAGAEAYYIWALDAAKQLDQRYKKQSKNWRSKGEVDVHFQPDNKLDEHGSVNIRKMLTEQFAPFILKNTGNITVNIEIPKTSVEGNNFIERYEQFVETGGDIKFPPEYVESVELSESITQLFDVGDQSGLELSVHSRPSTDVHTVQLDFASSKGGNVRIPHLATRFITGGTKEFTVSNIGQSGPYKFKAIIDKQEPKMTFTFRMTLKDTDFYQAREILRIHEIMSDPCIVRATFVDMGVSSERRLDEALYPKPEKELMQFVERVCKIQDALGMLFYWPDSGELSSQDYAITDVIMNIINHGRTEIRTAKLRLHLEPNEWRNVTENVDGEGHAKLQITSSSSKFGILGTFVELGPKIIHINGAVITQKGGELNEHKEPKRLLELSDAIITQEFELWPRP